MSEKVIDQALKDLQEKFGKGFIFQSGDEIRVAVEPIGSGSLALDMATKIPGLPRGKIVEYYGLESSGKSTMALRAVAAAQARGEYCAWIDAEQCMEPIWARKHGVIMEKGNPYDLFMVYPDWGEQAIEAIDTLAKTNKFALIVVDSVAALVSKAEHESAMDKATVGRQSQMMSTALRRLASVLNTSRTTVIFINQLREKIGVMFGNKYTTPGGLALKFYSSIRVEYYKKNLREGDEVIGSEIHFKIVKNKVRSPFGEGTAYLIHGAGIDEAQEIAKEAVDAGIVGFEGRRYTLDGQEIAVGIKEFLQKIRSDVPFRTGLKARILETLNPKPPVPPKHLTPIPGAPEPGAHILEQAPEVQDEINEATKLTVPDDDGQTRRRRKAHK